MYQFLLLSGLLICGIFYIIILATKTSVKIKLLCTGICILSAVLLWFLEPILINASYRIYVAQHKTILEETNQILSKGNEISISIHNVDDPDSVLSESDKIKLFENLKKLDVYVIDARDDQNYYGIWGFLDIRHGIVYWKENSIPNKELYTHIIGNWYY